MRRALIAVALAALGGCDGASSDRGLDADMIASGASFVAGAMPAEEGGPAVRAIDLSANVFHAGEIDKPLRGALDPEATAAAVGLTGDRGYWIVPAGLPDVAAPGFPTFDTALAFAADLPAGPYDLVVRAVDAQDRFGPAEVRALTGLAAPEPEGALVITLRWDTEADLDLHVTLPGGAVIWRGDPIEGGGALDADSNAACVIDGRREERVVFAADPPPGRYAARVDTSSLCAEAIAYWTVEVRLRGEAIGAAEGASLITDTYVTHDRGAGVRAIDFDVP